MISEKIENEVLSLPAEDRILLTDKLIQSLNLPIQKDIEKMWAEEAEQRIAELNSGTVVGIEGENVFNEIRARLNK